MTDKQVNVSIQFQSKVDTAQANIKALDDLLARLQQDAESAEKELTTLDQVSMEKKKQDIKVLRDLITKLSTESAEAKKQLASIDRSVPLAANKRLESIEKTLTELSVSADQAGQDFKAFGTLAEQSAQEAAAAWAKVEEDAAKEIDALVKQRDEYIQGLDRQKQQYSELGEASTQLAAVGGLIFAPAIASASAYVSAMGRSDAVSRKFIAAQERQSRAQQELGRKSAQALVPYVEAVAKITEQIGKLPPEVFQAGLALGGGLVLVGAIGTLGSQIGVFVATSTKLIAAINAGTASRGLSGVAYAGVGVAAVGAGAAIGIEVTRGIGRANGDERLANYDAEQALETIIQLLGIASAGLIKATGEAAKTVNTFYGLLQIAGVKISDALDKLVKSLEKASLDLVLGVLNTKIGSKTIADLLNIENEIAPLAQRRGEITAQENAEREKARQAIAREIEMRRENALALEEFNRRGGGVLGQPDTEFVPPNSEEDIAALYQDQRYTDIADRVNQSNQDIDQWIQGATDSMLRFFNFVSDEADSTSQEAYSTESLDALGAFNKETAQLEADYFNERVAKQKAFQEESAQLQEDYNDQQKNLLDAYNDQRKQAEQAYQQKVSDLRNQAQTDLLARELQYREDREALQQDFQKAEQQANEAYQRKRIQQERDFRDQLANAAAKLDAISVLDILRQQNRTATDEGENFNTEKRQRQEEQRDRLADLDRAYAKEKDQRQQQLQKALADAAKAFSEQQRQQKDNYERQRREAEDQFNKLRERRQKAYNDELNQMASQHQRTMQARDRAFRDQLDQMLGRNKYEAEAMRRHYEYLQRLMDSFLNSAQVRGDGATRTTTTRSGIVTTGGGGSSSGRTFGRTLTQFASGGYTSEGAAYLHNDEFVMDNATTKAAERGIGALNQQRLQQFFNSSSNSMGNVSINISGAGNPAATAREVKRVLLGVLNNLGQVRP